MEVEAESGDGEEEKNRVNGDRRELEMKGKEREEERRGAANPRGERRMKQRNGMKERKAEEVEEGKKGVKMREKTEGGWWKCGVLKEGGGVQNNCEVGGREEKQRSWGERG
uniref:Uncharacterized protein n=1 Tax=Knipowitschia caucasica TaxID=637954 RepID=A0AAV2L2N0_KNICA